MHSIKTPRIFTILKAQCSGMRQRFGNTILKMIRSQSTLATGSMTTIPSIVLIYTIRKRRESPCKLTRFYLNDTLMSLLCKRQLDGHPNTRNYLIPSQLINLSLKVRLDDSVRSPAFSQPSSAGFTQKRARIQSVLRFFNHYQPFHS